jgi:hypothetical protein
MWFYHLSYYVYSVCNIHFLRRAMAQAVSRRSLTEEAGFAPGSVHVGTVVNKWHWSRSQPYSLHLLHKFLASYGTGTLATVLTAARH